jgi:hypothetical protein
MPLDPSHDFCDVVDRLEAVAVTRPGSSIRVPVAHALRQAVRTREAEASAGRYTASDVAWHLPAAELPEPPRLGDAIVDGEGQSWTVLDVRLTTLGSRWRCVARNLAIAEGLDQCIDIEKATYTKSAAGTTEPSWSTWRSGVRARIQPAECEVGQNHERLGTRARYRVYLAENVLLDHTHRLRGPDGAVYRILASRRAERIDALMEIDVVKEP